VGSPAIHEALVLSKSLEPAVAWLIAFAMIIGMKTVVFILGYLTIRLGYHLVRSGVQGEFKFSAKLAGAQADLASISPGLLFVLLGVALISIAISVDKTVTVSGEGPVSHTRSAAVPDSLTFPMDGGDSLAIR
jgi:hypothetical protein